MEDNDKQIITDFISNQNNFRKIIQIDKRGINTEIDVEVNLPYILSIFEKTLDFTLNFGWERVI